MSTLIHGANQIVCITNSHQKYKVGKEMSELAILERNEEGLSIAINENGRILAVGKDSEVRSICSTTEWKHVIDATDKCVLPGLVDAHTHSVWAGDRVHEFAMKLEGATYLDIHAAGGGIHFTVQKTREATEEYLLQLLIQRFKHMSQAGTTLVECKSGYGLDLETEVKMLKVIEKARQDAPLSISSTFCGAHAVPKGQSVEEATKNIIEVQLPEIKRLVDQKELQVDSVDVFCEKGVFGVEETKKILTEAKKDGFLLNFHAEELNHIGGAEMGASLEAEAMSHLEEVTDDDITAMAKSQSVAVLLPTTAHLLKLKPPPARKMINAGVPVALGTDFNPNAHCLSMPLVMHLACVQLQLTMAESLVAATLNAAYSLRKSDDTGSIEIGKWADILIIDAPRWEHLIYQLGGECHLITHVLHHGSMVYRK